MGKSNIQQCFLVLRPAGEILYKAQSIQRFLAKEYNLYQRMPMLHVTLLQLEILKEEVLPLLIEKVGSIPDKGPILLYSKGYKCYHVNNRSITLLLKKTLPLTSLTQEIETSLQKIPGLRFTGPLLKEREFHITLASNFLAQNPWSEEVFLKVCEHMDRRDPSLFGWATSLEIWRPRLFPEEAILASFPLKELDPGK